jgi:predicted ribosome quality control (RQC) complex YloA/Tae2 family protein
MKTSLAGIELKQVVKELKFIEGGRIDKVYHPEKKELILQIHVPNIGKTMIRILVGKLMFKAEFRPEAHEPDSFCLMLRKMLANAKIEKIAQVGNERIVKIEFEGEERVTLYIELFGKGNIVICDKDGKVVNVEEKQLWTDRTLKKDEQYVYPKKEYDYSTITSEQLKALSEKKEMDIVKLLAAELGIGGVYAEEICTVSGIEKETKKLTDAEAKKVVDSIHSVANTKPEPVIVLKDGKVKDIVLFPLSIYKDYDVDKLETYNDALNKVYSQQMLFLDEQNKMEKYNEKIEKSEKVVEEQKEVVKKCTLQYTKNQEIAEKIYTNYQLISEVLDELKKAKEKFSIEEINKRLKGHKLVKSIGKDWKARVEL